MAVPRNTTPGKVPGADKSASGRDNPLATLPVSEVFSRLQSSADGLSGEEAKKRLDRYGPNELAEEKGNLLLKFLSYFWGPIPVMIMVAALLSGILRHWPDLGVIAALLVLNAVVGFHEEHQAGNAIAALKAKLSVRADVRRDGRWASIAAREVVPGDVVRLRIGNIVPADARLLDGDPVQVDQSALTGESLPVEHKAGEAVFSGSILKRGETNAVVYATGARTYFGRTAELVASAETRSHLQKAVLKIADYLLGVAVVLAALIVAVAVGRGNPFLEVLQFALVLTIAAVPVAMPAVLSVTMALGARRLAANRAVVTKLTSVEELAGVDVLCSDKTGTLTQNKLTPGDPATVRGTPAEQVIRAAALASRVEDEDAIDLAVLSGLKDKSALEAYTITHFLPFDPVHKRTEATVRDKDGREFKVTKGAPQVILALDPRAADIKDEVDQAVGEFAGRGFRSLGVARTDEKGRWDFLGVIPLSDPLRSDTKETIKAAERMGLKVKMVTGDQMAIAKEIARQLDLGTDIIDASVFGQTKAHEAGQLADAIERADGFAQVFPEHKYHIVDVLQQRGHIVGMTGDGVNDAPALKKADAGIAVSGATDAARAAASIVLLNPGLSMVVKAITESRRIFRRMLNYTIYRITETLALLAFLTLAIVLFKTYPVTAIMIVLLAILNDGAILSIAYDNVRLAARPERWEMRTVLGVATALGLVAMVRSFGILFVGRDLLHLGGDMVRTMVYLNLSVGGHLSVFAARTRGPFWTMRPSWILLGAVLGTQTLATLISVFGLFMAPLGWLPAAVVWGYCLVLFLIQDRVKLAAYRILGQEHSGFLVHLRPGRKAVSYAKDMPQA
jgi:H+-transporting ATPase